MKLDLQANPKVMLSVYSPTGKTIILEDSSAIAVGQETYQNPVSMNLS